MFLMYRVELKVPLSWPKPPSRVLWQVPNVPCGVESMAGNVQPITGMVFLMYRVELKVLLLP